MQAVVVFESMYGNTHAVADAIAEGLGDGTRVLAVGDADGDALGAADLLVVGGPTHVHGISSTRSRKAAVEDAAKKPELELDPAIGDEGLRDWLESLPGGLHLRAAAFDTRIDKPKLLTGSAARGIAHRLEHHGCDVVAEESFFVDTANQLGEGELERARAWGRQLAQGFEAIGSVGVTKTP